MARRSVFFAAAPSALRTLRPGADGPRPSRRWRRGRAGTGPGATTTTRPLLWPSSAAARTRMRRARVSPGCVTSTAGRGCRRLSLNAAAIACLGPRLLAGRCALPLSCRAPSLTGRITRRALDIACCDAWEELQRPSCPQTRAPGRTRRFASDAADAGIDARASFLSAPPASHMRLPRGPVVYVDCCIIPKSTCTSRTGAHELRNRAPAQSDHKRVCPL